MASTMIRRAVVATLTGTIVAAGIAAGGTAAWAAQSGVRVMANCDVYTDWTPVYRNQTGYGQDRSSFGKAAELARADARSKLWSGEKLGTCRFTGSK